MNALDALIVQHHVSLKICELCGRLYCRAPQGGPYCIACEVELREFPTPQSRKRRGRPVRPRPQFISKPIIGVFE